MHGHGSYCFWWHLVNLITSSWPQEDTVLGTVLNVKNEPKLIAKAHPKRPLTTFVGIMISRHQSLLSTYPVPFSHHHISSHTCYQHVRTILGSLFYVVHTFFSWRTLRSETTVYESDRWYRGWNLTVQVLSIDVPSDNIDQAMGWCCGKLWKHT